MSIPGFTLTKTIPVQVFREGKPTVVKGRPVPGPEIEFTIQANVQPFNFKDLQILPEADRTKEWIKLYMATPDLIRTAREGSDGYQADEVVYAGQRYKVMRIRSYRMGTLDHTHAIASRELISAK